MGTRLDTKMINPEQRLRDTVSGYVRQNYGDDIPIDIVRVIYEFYSIQIESNILLPEEQLNLLTLLYDTFIKQKEHQHIKSINTKLLFRASEHDYKCKQFHNLCDNQGPTITIIHNEHDHIYGGYTSKSWISANDKKVQDPHTFLFMIRPNVESIMPRNRTAPIWMYSGYGPIFGSGADVWIMDNCNTAKDNGCYGDVGSGSFDFDGVKMGGIQPENKHYKRCKFKIINYEVFAISIE